MTLAGKVLKLARPLAAKSPLCNPLTTVGAMRSAAVTAILVVLAGWVYYLAQIFFLSVELTKAFAHRYGSHRDGI